MNNAQYGLIGVIGLLLLAQLIGWLLPVGNKSRAEVLLRIRTWWLIVGFFSLALLLPAPWSVAVLGLVSFMAFKEFITLTPSRAQDRITLFWAFAAIPLQYLWVAQGWFGMFLIFIPVYMFLLLAARLVLSGSPDGFLRSATTLHWGLMSTVFVLSHLAYLLMLPTRELNGISIGGAGLLFFLVFVTQLNDVAQFVWGKTCGRRKILPLVSPNKTWEGFLGGVATTGVVCALLAAYFTPLSMPRALLAGVLLGVFGFIGDVVMSAIKRDLGVKDTGTLLPGHGGILDRLDSLTFTAPLYFHALYYLYY